MRGFVRTTVGHSLKTTSLMVSTQMPRTLMKRSVQVGRLSSVVLSRYASSDTSGGGNKPKGSSVVFSAEEQALFSSARCEELRVRLSLLPQKKLTLEDFALECQKVVPQLAKEISGPSLSASRLALFWHQKGEVFFFSAGGVNYVVLDTQYITHTLEGLLDPSGQIVRQMVAAKQAQLQDLIKRQEQLTALKRIVDRRADRSVRRMMWALVTYMAAQTLLVTRLTFWDLSWDIMEPITYMGNVVIGAMGVWWFGLTKVDPQYRNVWSHLQQARAKRFAKKLQFDEVQYANLQKEITRTEEDLALWREGSYIRDGFRAHTL